MRRPQSSTSLAHDGHVGAAVVLASSFVLGLALGLTLPADKSLPHGWTRLSSVLGWTCFGCWMVGWYPQLISNWHSKSVIGLSFDNAIYNWIGFTCYSIFNCALFFSKAIQAQYRAAHHGLDSDVRVNDVFFSLHANLMTTIGIIQICRYDRGNQRVSRTCSLLVTLVIAMVAMYGIMLLVSTQFGSDLLIQLPVSTLGFLYLLSYVKLAMTLIKYIPQVILNYKRKSTVGWNVANALTDFAGGILSMGQQILDLIVLNDPSVLTGDLAKFGLGLISILYCLALMFQHYVLYPERTYVHLKPADAVNASSEVDPDTI